VKFGIQHGVGDPAWTPAILAPIAVTQFARAVEDAGFSHIAFTDHPAPSLRWIRGGGEGAADPMSSLGFCAAVTTRLRLLTFVLVVAYRSPLLAAHQLATLDVLSDGRLTVGLGTGYLRAELLALGADVENRLAAFDQGIDMMRTAWRGPVDWHGPGMTAREVHVRPLVVQTPHPPLWIHGNSSFGLERAARHGQGWIGMRTTDVLARTARTRPLPDVAALGRRVGDLRDATLRAGRKVDDVEVVAAGFLPPLDVRTGWNVDAHGEVIAELRAAGVETLLVTVCGDDPTASVDSVHKFGADFIDRREQG
jgi:probable F420-dependent oxidoreductase